MKEAIILAGGKGLRLKGQTEVPKPFLIVKPETGETILEAQLKWLVAYDYEHVILAMSRQNFKYMRVNYSKFLNVPSIDVSIEEENLGTGGGLKKALEFIEEPNFYCFNADDVCYSEDTRFLTKLNGWRQLKDIEIGEEILTFNKSKEQVEFQPLLHKIIRPYNGKMIHFLTEHVDLFVTPEHRVLIRSRNRRKLKGRGPYNVDPYHEYPAISLLSNSEIWLPTNYRQEDKQEYPLSDDKIKLAGWIFSEGSYPKNDPRVCISQSEEVNPKYVNEIKYVLQKLGMAYSFSSRLNFKIHAKDSRRIKKWLPQKEFVPREWINGFSNRQLELLFMEMYKGDGTKDRRIFTSYNPRLLEQVQEILIRLGYKSLRKEHVVYFEKSKSWEAIRPERRFLEDYHGIVVCPSVKNSFVVLERRGKIAISGNCFYNPEELHISQQITNAILIKQATLPFGAVEFDSDMKVTNFIEKPVIDKFVSCGHYVFNRKLIEELLPDVGDLEQTFLKDLAKMGLLNAHVLKGRWITINTYKELIETRGRMKIDDILRQDKGSEAEESST